MPVIKRKLDEADATLQELRKGLIMGRAVSGAVSQASRALIHAFDTGALAPQRARAFFLRAEACRRSGHRRRAVLSGRHISG